MLRGFGKNYFTLSSILAHAVAHKLHSQVTSAQTLLRLNNDKEPLEEGDPPEELLEERTALQSVKPCHCNCYINVKHVLYCF